MNGTIYMPVGEVCSSISDTYREKKNMVTLINTSDVLEGRVLNHERVPNSNLKGQFKKTFQRDDILYSEIRPQNRRFAYVDFSPIDYIASTKLMVIRAKKDVVSPKYLYYFLKNSSTVAELQLLAETRSGTFPQITFSEVANLTIPVPSLAVQEVIVQTMQCLEDKITCNEQINDNLEQQAQAIYHERFETVSPNDLPSDWRIVTLGEVATISNKSFNPLKEPEILLEHYSIPAFDEARFPVFELSTSIKSNKFIIDASCFMISKLNPTTKRVWKPYCLTGNAVCSTEFIVYKAKDKTITDFLYSVIDSNSFSDFMCSHVTGSTGSRQRTTPSDTLSYELILPSEDELAEFQSLVSPMYAQIRINAIENDRLKRLRDSLLPKLMSGEIDVSTIQL
ncbi:restriction endonuclease subunit S [Ruthenibacterium lactatiformans]|nr:restriction endonuclease subunit S [Ruthenibacterium lactatiformans]